MKRLLLCVLLVLTAHAATAAQPDTLQFGRFGVVHLYWPKVPPQSVVVFVSGDGGWNLGVVDMAKELTTLDALVIGVDITHFLKQLAVENKDCSYPAADFEALSQYVQKRIELPDYHIPYLVGYSSGATLVYALLVQAPTNTFAGAVSLGFCPDLPLTKPFCKGNGLEYEPGPKGKGYSFLPAPNLEVPWVAFQGMIDQVCDPKFVDGYVKKVGNARLVSLPKVGHGFSVPKNWLPQFREIYQQISNTQHPTDTVRAGDLADLPLVVIPAKGKDAKTLAVIVSGDGGWASIDRQVGQALVDEGISVVGLNSLKYFWQRRTPDQAAVDLSRIIRFYQNQWHPDNVVLVGYSRGADVVPFMANRLPADQLEQVKLIALLGPDDAVDFQFHLTDFLGDHHRSTDLPVLPEVQALKGKQVLCYYGADEKESLCRKLDTSWATLVEAKGGHHFGGDYQTIAKTILRLLGQGS